MRVATLFRVALATLFFAIPAVFHALALKWPHLSVPETPLHHGVFVVVNGVFAFMLIRPVSRLFFLGALTGLTTHQLVIHGEMLVRAATAEEPHFDLQSFVVLFGFALLWPLVLHFRSTIWSEEG